MGKVLILFALLAVGDAKFGSVLFDIFGNIYKVTLPHPAKTPVTKAASTRAPTTPEAYNPLDPFGFLKIFDHIDSTTAPIIPNPISFLDIFKPEASRPGVPAIPSSMPITLPASTTPNIPRATIPSLGSSVAPPVSLPASSVPPAASSSLPTISGDLTSKLPGAISTALPITSVIPGASTAIPAISTPSFATSDVSSVLPPASSNLPKNPELPGSIPTTLPTYTTPSVPGASTPSVSPSDVSSVSPPASPGLPKIPGYGDLSTKLPGIPGISTPSIGTSDVHSVSPPAFSELPAVPGFGDINTKLPGSIPTTLPTYTTPSVPGASTPSVGPSDVPSVSPPAALGLPTVPGDLTTKLPGSIPAALPTTPNIPGVSTPSTSVSDVSSVSPPASSGLPKVPGIGDLSPTLPGSIPTSSPTYTTPIVPGASTPSIGSSDIPSVPTAASSGLPTVPSDLTTKLPGSILTTLPAYTTPNVPGASTPSIGNSNVPSVPGFGDLSPKLPDSISTALPTTSDISKVSTPSIATSNPHSVSPPTPSGFPKVPGFGDLSPKLPGSIPNSLPSAAYPPGLPIPSTGTSDVPSISPPASSGLPKVPEFGNLSPKLPGSIPNSLPSAAYPPGVSTPSIGNSDVPSISPPASSDLPKVPGFGNLSPKLPGSIPNSLPSAAYPPGVSTPSIGNSDVPSISPPASSDLPKVPGFDNLSPKLPDASTFKPPSLGGLPDSPLTTAKGKGDLISDAVNVFSGAAKNPFGRK